MQAAFWQFVYAPARKMRDCKGRSRLSARSALQSVSRFEVSTGDPRLFAAGFPIGARSIPVGTRFCFAKSSVLYLCLRLTRERGWRRTLRCGRVWQQTLFRGSRTGGFCDTKVTQMQDFWKAKSDWPEKEAEVYISSRPAAAPPLFQRFFRFPLPWVMDVFPRWLMGLFRYLDSLSISISETNCSFESLS